MARQSVSRPRPRLCRTTQAQSASRAKGLTVNCRSTGDVTAAGVSVSSGCNWKVGEPATSNVDAHDYLVQEVPESADGRGWMDRPVTDRYRCALCSRSPCGIPATPSNLEKLRDGAMKPARYFPFCSETQTLSKTSALTLTKVLRKTETVSVTRSVTRSVSLTLTNTVRPKPSASDTFSATRSLSASTTTSLSASVTATSTFGTVTLSKTMLVSESLTITSTLGTRSMSKTRLVSDSLAVTSTRNTASATITHTTTLTSSESLTPSGGTLAATVSRTLLPTDSFTLYATVTQTRDTSPSASLKRTASRTLTASTTQAVTLSSTVRPTPSLTADASASTSQRVTATDSLISTPSRQTLSASNSPLSTETLSLTQTLGVTLTCDSIAEDAAGDLCRVIKPTDALGEWFTSVDGGDGGNDGSCLKASVSYSDWGGKRGSTFWAHFAVNKSYNHVNSHGNTTLPQLSGPAASAFRPIHMHCDAKNYTVSVKLEYTGSDTMSSPGTFSIVLPSRTLRCPHLAPLSFTIHPTKAPKSAVSDVAEYIQQVAGAISIVMAMPAVAAQMGMLSGLQDLTRCEPADLEEPLDFMNNPIDLGLGDAWGAPQRGVLVGTIVIVIAFSGVLFVLAGFKLWVARVRGKAHRNNNKEWPPTFVTQLRSFGAPGVYLLVSAFLMDSTVTAGVALVIFGRSIGDRILGSVFALIGYAYVASLFYTTLRADLVVEGSAHVASDEELKAALEGGSSTLVVPLLLPPADSVDEFSDIREMDTGVEMGEEMVSSSSYSPQSQLEASRNDKNNDEKKPPSAVTCLRRWFTPTAEFSGSDAFLATYGEYVKDLKGVKCYRGVELTAVCIVSSLQAAAFGDQISCVVELSLAFLSLLVLFIVVASRRPHVGPL